jgi:hypothetical protein
LVFRCGLHQIHPITLGQISRGFHETQILNIHEKLDGITTLLTAKTLVNSNGWGYDKGGRFFVVEWTATLVSGAGAFERNIIANHILDGYGVQQLV